MNVSDDDNTVSGASMPPDMPMKTEGLLPKRRPSIANVGFDVYRSFATAFVIVNCCGELFWPSAFAEQKRVRQIKSTNAIHEVFLTTGPSLAGFLQAGIFRIRARFRVWSASCQTLLGWMGHPVWAWPSL